jgi:hypothetical protein
MNASPQFLVFSLWFVVKKVAQCKPQTTNDKPQTITARVFNEKDRKND